MNPSPHSLTVAVPHVPRRTLRAFVELSKPRLVSMVLVTTLVGFYLGSSGSPDYLLLIATLIGTALAAGGTLALNQYVERELDARMERTHSRPLPSGRLQPIDALVFGAALAASGVVVLMLTVNALSALVTATVVVTYLAWYTPLKLRSPLCSLVGAIPGALPPVAGWVAASGRFGVGAGVLFAILYLWQLPHSLAIAKLYADDFARAGFKLLPIVDRDGSSTERQMVINCAALLVVSMIPTLVGLAGVGYLFASFVLGSGFLVCTVVAARSRTPTAARGVMIASLVYLPVLLAAMALDRVG